MKENLPLWFQTLAVILLNGVFMATVGWVWDLDRNDPVFRGRGGAEFVAGPFIFVWMPIPLLVLCGRLLWRFDSIEGGRRWYESALCMLAVASVIPAALALAFSFAPGVQRVRDAGYAAAIARQIPPV